MGNVAALLGDVAATRQEREAVANHGRWGAAAEEELDLLDLLPPEPQLLNLARPTPLARMRGSSRASGLARANLPQGREPAQQTSAPDVQKRKLQNNKAAAKPCPPGQRGRAWAT